MIKEILKVYLDNFNVWDRESENTIQYSIDTMTDDLDGKLIHALVVNDFSIISINVQSNYITDEDKIIIIVEKSK